MNHSLRSAELQLAHIRARMHFPELHVPSKLSLALRNFNFRMADRITYSRSDLKTFWKRTSRRKGALFRPDRIALNFLMDFQLFILFMHALGRQLLEPTAI